MFRIGTKVLRVVPAYCTYTSAYSVVRTFSGGTRTGTCCSDVSRIYVSPKSQHYDFVDTSPDSNPTSSFIFISPPYHHQNRSYIRTIRSHKLAGFVGESDASTENDDGDVVISFSDPSAMVRGSDTATSSNGTTTTSRNNLIAVTGETASGKSLFIVRALEIISGKIASTQKLTSYIHLSRETDTSTSSSAYDVPSANKNDMFVEVEVVLVDPHLSAIEQILHQQNNWKSDSPLEIVGTVNDDHPRHERFLFRRTLQLIPVKGKDSQRRRLKSVCTINGRVIPLKGFVMLTSPLFAVVDAGTAINAILSKSISNGKDRSDVRRTYILDAAISQRKLWNVNQAQQQFQRCRSIRLQYEKQLQYLQRNLRFTNKNGDDQSHDLLSHYIDELDSFASRITRFCQSFDIDSDNDDPLSSMTVVRIGRQLSQAKWSDNVNEDSISRQKSNRAQRNRMYQECSSYFCNFKMNLRPLTINFKWRHKLQTPLAH